MPEEKKSKEPQGPNALRIILPILFVVLLVTCVYALYPLLTTNDGPQIINNVITLRSTDDTRAMSRLVTDTDLMVRNTNARVLVSEWQVLTDCLPQGCDDAEFFNFITLVTQHLDVNNKELIQNMIATYKYWGSEEIIRFSKAMTAVEKDVDDAFSRALEEKWSQIVECDGSCENENNLFFEAITIAVELE